MVHEKVKLTNKHADGYVIPLGPVNLVNVVTDMGMVGCRALTWLHWTILVIQRPG
jgi:hypothetical protein